MSLVVFLRGVNVGGHKAFQPSALARELSRLEVRSIGAAGTFVVSGRATEKQVRAEFLKHLPFDALLMTCNATELAALVSEDPFARSVEDTKAYVSVLEKRPRVLPRLPLDAPEGKDWQVRLFAIRGPFVLSLHRRAGRALVYPNEVVEKRLGVAATTRNWSTILKVREALDQG